jgi:predicted nucleic acid-binding protein
MLVVDTCVAVKWVVPESGAGIESDTDIALTLLGRGLVAPDCILAEFANALWKKVCRAEIPADQAREAVAILPELVTLLPSSAFIAPALELALTLNHPVHDCVFLATALQMEIPLITADMKFVERCKTSAHKELIFPLLDRGWL